MIGDRPHTERLRDYYKMPKATHKEIVAYVSYLNRKREILSIIR